MAFVTQVNAKISEAQHAGKIRNVRAAWNMGQRLKNGDNSCIVNYLRCPTPVPRGD